MKRLLLILACLVPLQSAWSCPDIYGIPDFNCDEVLQIVVIGDSLAYGFGDTKNRNKGGYVLRLEKKLKNASITNFGELGLNTWQLIKLLNKWYKQRSRKAVLVNADIVILDLGRNDRWAFGLPKTTFDNLALIAKRIKREAIKAKGLAPIVVTSVLMLPNRGSQGPWVKELNGIILNSSTRSAPADLRFDLVSKRLLNPDNIHPSSLGYDELYKVLYSYLRGSLAKKMKALRPDSDGDRIPNVVEQKKFETDPYNADTDGDGKSDGEEILTTRTDPLVAD